MQVVRIVRRAIASDIFRGLSIFIGSLAALLVAFTLRDQHQERICWFERTAEVDEIEARIQAVTSRIFTVALTNPEERPPELQDLARNSKG